MNTYTVGDTVVWGRGFHSQISEIENDKVTLDLGQGMYCTLSVDKIAWPDPLFDTEILETLKGLAKEIAPLSPQISMKEITVRLAYANDRDESWHICKDGDGYIAYHNNHWQMSEFADGCIRFTADEWRAVRQKSLNDAYDMILPIENSQTVRKSASDLDEAKGTLRNLESRYDAARLAGDKETAAQIDQHFVHALRELWRVMKEEEGR